jgi:hypothetical protein
MVEGTGQASTNGRPIANRIDGKDLRAAIKMAQGDNPQAQTKTIQIILRLMTESEFKNTFIIGDRPFRAGKDDTTLGVDDANYINTQLKQGLEISENSEYGDIRSALIKLADFKLSIDEGKEIDLIKLLGNLKIRGYFKEADEAKKKAIMLSVLGEMKLLTFDAYMKTPDGKAFDENMRILYEKRGLEGPDLQKYEDMLDQVEREIYETPETTKLTYKAIEEKIGEGLSRKGIVFLRSLLNPLYADRCAKQGTFTLGFLQEIRSANDRLLADTATRKETLRQSSGVANAEAIVKKIIFGSMADAAVSGVLDDNRITREEAINTLHMSPQLFTLITNNMQAGGTGRGDISIDQLNTFQETITRYVNASGLGENVAAALYRNARTFRTVNLDVLAAARDRIQSEFKITANTKFSDIEALIDPKLLPALRWKFAQLRGIKPGKITSGYRVFKEGGTNSEENAANAIRSLCSFLSMLALLSQLDEDTQREVLHFTLPRYEGDIGKITENSILKYIRKKEAARAAGGRTAESTGEASGTTGSTPPATPPTPPTPKMALIVKSSSGSPVASSSGVYIVKKESPFTIKFDPVRSAETYKYLLNGLYTTIEGCQFEIPANQKPGDYKITILAYGEDTSQPPITKQEITIRIK